MWNMPQVTRQSPCVRDRRSGRGRATALSMATGGACCLVLAVLEGSCSSGDSVVAGTVAAAGLVGKLAVTAAFSAMWVVAGESVPTTALRARAVSLAAAAAHVGALISPIFGFSVAPAAAFAASGAGLVAAAAATGKFVVQLLPAAAPAISRERERER